MTQDLYLFVSKRLKQTNFQQEWMEENENYYKTQFYKDLTTYLYSTSKGKRLGKNHLVVEKFLQTLQNSPFLHSEIVSYVCTEFTRALINTQKNARFFHEDTYEELDFLMKSCSYIHINYKEIYMNLTYLFSVKLKNISEKYSSMKDLETIRAKDLFTVISIYNKEKDITYSDISDLKIDYFLDKLSYKYITKPETVLSKTDKDFYFYLLERCERQLFVYRLLHCIKTVNAIKHKDQLYWTNFNLFLLHLRIFLLKHIDIEKIDICSQCNTVFYINYSTRKYCSKSCTVRAASRTYKNNLEKKDNIFSSKREYIIE